MITKGNLFQKKTSNNGQGNKDNTSTNFTFRNTENSQSKVICNVKINPANEPTQIFENQNHEVPLISETKAFWDGVSRAVLRIEQRRHLWDDQVRTQKSPTVQAMINKTVLSKATIDEGSELNVVDYKFCIRWKIEFCPTFHSATAAGSSIMKVRGQTTKAVTLHLPEGAVC